MQFIRNQFIRNYLYIEIYRYIQKSGYSCGPMLCPSQMHQGVLNGWCSAHLNNYLLKTHLLILIINLIFTSSINQQDQYMYHRKKVTQLCWTPTFNTITKNTSLKEQLDYCGIFGGICFKLISIQCSSFRLHSHCPLQAVYYSTNTGERAKAACLFSHHNFHKVCGSILQKQAKPSSGLDYFVN